MKPQTQETALIGAWIFVEGKVIADAVCKRIDWLADNYLQRITDSIESGGWDTLYQDPEDGRFWELVYPYSDMHGGGPASLKCLNRELAIKKFDLENIESMNQRAARYANWKTNTRRVAVYGSQPSDLNQPARNLQ